MSLVLANLQPTALWGHFEAISAIPRCSKKEQAVVKYVVEQAQRLGLDHKTDAAGNIVVSKPAAAAYAGRPTVVLQGHLDMVCEKNMGVEHDFSRDPIRLVQDGDWVRAADTTLGADNGIAVAMMLAILEGTEETGPIECLFTLDEESGLTGALGLDPALVSGRLLINLDTEDEGFFCIGCAGGLNSYISAPIVYFDSSTDGSDGLRLEVTGLRGGHSGVEIHEQRGNALQIGGRLLSAVSAAAPGARVATVRGGDKHNAIPRELRFDVRVPKAERAAFDAALEAFTSIIADELGDQEKDLQISKSEIETPGRVLADASHTLLVNLLNAVPNGVLRMSPDVEGLVETSTNLAAIRIDGQELKVLTSQRSSRESAIDWAGGILAAVAGLAGASYRAGERYPSWTPDPTSGILATAREVYREMTGTEAKVVAFHAGLECGVIGAKIPGIEMISFGPDIKGAHTPTERLSISSTERVYKLLVLLLQRIGA